ncbi:MAG: type 12 methyltransferase [Ramlibacter sp.]|uniref:glycosyltransferase n=1 Tax=Ramlibacter sp. TaxID=1917967 RepID=UPI00260B74C2|nr:glycosyltransferase [Ramlibacter sp.]MDB5751312.1 type 12 methyltransferase [Ramlibacter sp.]
MSIKDLTHDRVWEAYHGELGPNFMRDTQQRVNWICSMVDGKRVLDIGCSQGIVPILLAREGRTVTGVDSDPKAIEQALHHLSEEAAFVQERVQFIAADFMSHEGLRGQKFDTIVMSEVLEHLVRPGDFVREAVEYLVDGGSIVVSVPFGINDFIDHKQTFYLSEPFRLLSERMEVTTVRMLGKWLGLVAIKSPGAAAGSADKAWTQAEMVELERAFHQIERALRDDVSAKAAKLAKLMSDVKAANDQLSKLKQDKSKDQTAHEAAVQGLRAESETLKRAAQALSADTTQLRQAAATAQEALKEEARRSQDLAADAAQLRQAIGTAQKAAAERQTELNRALRQLEQLTQSFHRQKAEIAERVENSLSFQLGHTLIHGFKSWSGMAGLVPNLLRIRRESVQRKDIRRKRRLGQEALLPETSAQRSARSGVPEGPSAKPAGRTGSSASAHRNLTSAPTLRPVPGKLRIAGVMDEFTFHSYAPECELLQLRPDSWQEQLESFKPDLLFIESAWKGVDGLWQTKISNASPEILGAIAWCRTRSVPSLLWNKEDPVHFGAFLALAKEVDHVFTTDIDCIPRYKRNVGHDRVYLLPFAAQPATHNPIELYERKDAFNFAGSYYLRYPERQRDFASLIDTLQQFKPVEIYDRNFEKPHPHYQFPDKYVPMILGSLPFAEIDRAYKGYRYGINMNTIKQSQTMFARRVFELLASNTVVVSNFSRGTRMMFGDLVISSDEGAQLSRRVSAICNDDQAYRKLRLLGLRKVMGEHTYAHRLAYVRSKLSALPFALRAPSVAMVAVASTAAELDRVLASFRRQRHTEKRLFVVTPADRASHQLDDKVRFFADPLACAEAVLREAGTNLVGLFQAGDHYAAHYLTDLALASTYSDATAFCKAAHYAARHDECVLVNNGQQYRPQDHAAARAGVVRLAAATPQLLAEWLARPDVATLPAGTILAIDEFNYCREGASLTSEALAQPVGDLDMPDQGVSFLGDLVQVAESMTPDAGASSSGQNGLPQLTAKDLVELLAQPASPQLQLRLQNGALEIASRLPAGKVAHVFARMALEREPLNLVLNSQIQLECDSNLDLRTIFEFQTATGVKIAHASNAAGGVHALAIPPNCKFVRIGLRVCGPGRATVQRLVLGSHGERPAAVVGRSPYLVLTKQYPAYDDLYRYGFLHSRVRSYRETGLLTEVFRISSEPGQTYREFEGVDIASGDAHLLDATLRSRRYEHVLVHLLDEKMWQVLQHHLDKVRVTVWVHGAEIQVWQRRAFEFDRLDEAEIARQKKLSDRRVAFWRSILATPHPNLHLVFVSQHFADEVAQDLGLELKPSLYSIVHNFIDGSLFSYTEKRPEDRTRLLSIRPYSSRKYANDLTVGAIKELSARPCFSQLQFLLVGDGELFEETTRDLQAFSNVKLERRFLTHQEITQLHGNHGVFLTPTRMDSQGVSRDEAMASGLVPITTAVAAIPEFVDETCGIVVPPEDAKAIADAMERLYAEPDTFLQLSRAAALRVRRQSGWDQTIGREAALIQDSTARG